MASLLSVRQILGWLVPAALLLGMASPASADWARIFARSGPGPAIGEPAPVFTLREIETQREISMTELHRERALVLIFGSFT